MQDVKLQDNEFKLYFELVGKPSKGFQWGHVLQNPFPCSLENSWKAQRLMMDSNVVVCF